MTVTRCRVSFAHLCHPEYRPDLYCGNHPPCRTHRNGASRDQRSGSCRAMDPPTPVDRGGERVITSLRPHATWTRRRRIVLTMASIVVAFALYEIVTSWVAYTGDAYVLSYLVTLAPEVTGRIIAVHVIDNQNVTQGDLVVTIDPTPFQLLVDQRQAEVNEASAQIAADQDTIAATQAALAAATDAATFANETQTRQATLAKMQDVSRADLDQADDDLRRANAALDATRADVSRAQSTTAMHLAAQVRAASQLARAQCSWHAPG